MLLFQTLCRDLTSISLAVLGTTKCHLGPLSRKCFCTSCKESHQLKVFSPSEGWPFTLAFPEAHALPLIQRWIHAGASMPGHLNGESSARLFHSEVARSQPRLSLGLLGNQYLPLPNPASFSTLPQEMVPTASFINNEHPLC